jgi:uncharacterized membrane protein
VAALLFCWLNAVTGRSVHFFTGVPYDARRPLCLAGLSGCCRRSLVGTGPDFDHLGSKEREARPIWLAGAGLLTLVVVKLFLIDLSGTGTIGRIVSFLVVGLLMLIIGFFAPLPPKTQESSP